MSKIKAQLKSIIKKYSRIHKDNMDRKRLIDSDFTIFASNCIGGIIYHNLGLKFLSPTVNLWIEPEDYISMLSDPKDYFVPGKMIEEKNTKESFPIGIIGDKKIYGVHYKSFDQLRNKWDERCKRINWNKIIVFMIQRDDATYQDLEAFDKLPYDRKVVFTKEKYPEIKSSFVIPGTYDINKDNVNNLCIFLNGHSNLREIDKYDYVNFINTGEKQINKKYIKKFK